ncbi:carbohydrate kinase family protein [Streptomyces boninensis]|uniref:carbohydrate kinase family protein n=1 Tax=Streptomyces boninensis TaxID=2039455 RepID=UPI003B210C3E
MKIAITGSIATDHLMTFDGRFTDQLIAAKLETLSLSFAVDDLEVRRGGVAANICFGLGTLGLNPLLVGAAGHDFEPYRSWLDRHGVDTTGVRISATRRTARFVCTTDRAHNQIGSFYAGAMAEARHIDLAAIGDRAGGLDLVMISPDDPAAMVRHTRQCAEAGIVFIADPSQQLARMTRDDARALLAGPRYLITNEYESVLIQELTGWTEQQILGRVGTWVTTRGADSVHLRQACRLSLDVKSVPAAGPLEPTGAGDAFRAGFLAALSRGLPEERAAQLGAAMATTALETVGTQTYVLQPARLTAMIRDTYGVAAAEELSAHLAVLR